MHGRRKEGNEVKEGTYAKVESYISGDYFLLLVGIGVLNTQHQ